MPVAASGIGFSPSGRGPTSRSRSICGRSSRPWTVSSEGPRIQDLADLFGPSDDGRGPVARTLARPASWASGRHEAGPGPLRRAPGTSVWCDGRRGSAEEVTLPEVDAERPQLVALASGLDAFGDELAAALEGEVDDPSNKRLADVVVIDVADERDIKLHEVGVQLEDVAKAREAGAGIVN